MVVTERNGIFSYIELKLIGFLIAFANKNNLRWTLQDLTHVNSDSQHCAIKPMQSW